MLLVLSLRTMAFIDSMLELDHQNRALEPNAFQQWLLSRDTTDNVCVDWLREIVLSKPVHSQSVEAVFALTDHVMKDHNLGGKLKPTEKQGHIQSPDLLESFLIVRQAFGQLRNEAISDHVADLLEERRLSLSAFGQSVDAAKTPGRGTGVQAKGPKIKAAMQLLERSPGDDHVAEAAKAAKVKRKRYQSSKGSNITPEAEDKLQRQLAAKKPRNLEDLYEREVNVELASATICYDDDKCPENMRGKQAAVKRRGEGCWRWFHQQCLQNNMMLRRRGPQPAQVLCGGEGQCYREPLAPQATKKKKKRERKKKSQ